MGRNKQFSPDLSFSVGHERTVPWILDEPEFGLTITHQPLPGHMTHDSCRSPTLIAPHRTQIPMAVIFLFKFET